MTTNRNFEVPLKRFSSLCQSVPFNKLWYGVTYAAEANIYRPATIADMELSSTHCLLLALLKSLMAGDVTFCLLLSDICHKIENLRSRHYEVWLLEDFVFPRPDIQKAMALLAELAADGVLHLPPHVMRIMTSLANKYDVIDMRLRTISEEDFSDLTRKLKNAVINNSPKDIIAIATEGGDVNVSTQSGDSLIHLAARAGNSASITALNFMKADLEAVNSRNATPLLEALKNNHVSTVKTLLMDGAKVDKRFYRGDTYLHIAAAEGSSQVLEVLLEKGMEVNEKNYFDETPLVQAVKAGNVRNVEILLENGADSSFVPEGEVCITKMILESRNPDMLKAFVKNRADLNSVDGDTILHSIARSGNIEMLNVIKNLRLPRNIRNRNGLTPLHVTLDPSVVRVLIRMGIDVNTKTAKGETALHLASAKGSLELVKVLVQLGAVVDSQDDGGTTALMVACANSKEDIVTFLLYNGANPKLKDNGGLMPLHFAAKVGCIGSAIALLDAGVKVNDQDNKGDTPAFLADVNKPTVLELLLERGADLTQRDSNGEGIIHRVARSGSMEIMTKLLDDAEVEVDLRNRVEMTALHVAARRGHIAMVTALLDCGADLEAKDGNGYTALMRASNQGHLIMVQLLIDRGAVVNERDKTGRTALHWANSNGKKAESVVHYLKSIGRIE